MNPLYRSKSVPTLSVRFDRWISDDEFIGLYRDGTEVICHKDYWEEIDIYERKESEEGAADVRFES